MILVLTWQCHECLDHSQTSGLNILILADVKSLTEDRSESFMTNFPQILPATLKSCFGWH